MSQFEKYINRPAFSGNTGDVRKEIEYICSKKHEIKKIWDASLGALKNYIETKKVTDINKVLKFINSELRYRGF